MCCCPVAKIAVGIVSHAPQAARWDGDRDRQNGGIAGPAVLNRVRREAPVLIAVQRRCDAGDGQCCGIRSAERRVTRRSDGRRRVSQVRPRIAAIRADLPLVRRRPHAGRCGRHREVYCATRHHRVIHRLDREYRRSIRCQFHHVAGDTACSSRHHAPVLIAVCRCRRACDSQCRCRRSAVRRRVSQVGPGITAVCADLPLVAGLGVATRRDAELCQLTDRNHHAGGLAGNPW